MERALKREDDLEIDEIIAKTQRSIRNREMEFGHLYEFSSIEMFPRVQSYENL